MNIFHNSFFFLAVTLLSQVIEGIFVLEGAVENSDIKSTKAFSVVFLNPSGGGEYALRGEYFPENEAPHLNSIFFPSQVKAKPVPLGAIQVFKATKDMTIKLFDNVADSQPKAIVTVKNTITDEKDNAWLTLTDAFDHSTPNVDIKWLDRAAYVKNGFRLEKIEIHVERNIDYDTMTRNLQGYPHIRLPENMKDLWVH